MSPSENGLSATVDVLTAEVRVLMVGSRQVTLSVYRQLDFFSPFQIESFGRVRAERSRSKWETTEVVGRDPSGALVRSVLYTEPHKMERWSFDRAVALGPENFYEPALGEEDRLWLEAQELMTQWWRLPLIVLAGLR